jgi:tetratricopeptide (TPR) repeat protein
MSSNEIHRVLSEASYLLEAGRPAETLNCLRRIPVLADDEFRIERGSLRAWALADLGHVDQALRTLEPLLEAHPLSARLHGTLGVVLSSDGNLERASEALEQAVALDADDPTTLANLALVHERLREFETALELYDQAIDAGADIDWLLERKATVHAELGQYAEAKSTLRRYLSIEPDDARKLIFLATLHGDEQEYDEAFSCFARAERAAPNSSSLRLNWGILAAQAGRFSVAERQLRLLRHIEPRSARVALLEAVVHDHRGEIARASECYDLAVNCAEAGDVCLFEDTLEMAIDFFARNGFSARCERIFGAAYGGNACTIELCESYRCAVGDRVEHATWYSLLIEAAYRPGLREIPDRDTTGAKQELTRYARNVQVVARNRDEAIAIVTALLRRMGEQRVLVTEFVSEEPLDGAHIGVYEIEPEAAVYGTETDSRA